MAEHKKKSLELLEYMNRLSARIMITQKELFDDEFGKLNIKEVNIIKVIDGLGECKMRDISNSLTLADSTLTGITDSLVRKNYIKRRRTEEDRRVVKVSLTEKGKNFSNLLTEKHLEIYDHMLDTLNNTEQLEILALFKKIAENFN